ncbi:hypothetical protein GCM10025783_22340 [Amnibacterium soli]|uniref:Type II secretion system protein GspE N-terminal domain-containing protein n=1 Tax=Amnibacterium soli TaxID=1282736 RepID=A0ABP8Z8P3_9MICO
MSVITPSGANVFGAPFVEILEYPVDREAAVSISANLCRRHHLLPIGREGGTLIVAMADPNDILALDDVSAATRLRIRPVLVDPKDLSTVIDRYHRADDELSDLQHELSEQGPSGRPPPSSRTTTRPSCASSTCSSRRPSRTAPPTSTSSPASTSCGSATASTAC